MLRNYVTAALRPAWAPLRRHLGALVDERASNVLEAGLQAAHLQRAETESRVQTLMAQQSETAALVGLLRQGLFVPDPSLVSAADDAVVFPFSNCQAQDFFHPRYKTVAKLMAMSPMLHRKQWEWVYIVHKLLEADVVRPGCRGLGFGVGRERLPAVFASLGADVVATDAPADLASSALWSGDLQTSSQRNYMLTPIQFSSEVESLLYADIAPNEIVRAHVTHRPCDMNNIDETLTGFDFNWSSCCFEHLGTIEAGLLFVISAIERTLRVGGVGVHTTEFNLSSNDETVSSGNTVIYRRRDLEELVDRLRQRGHEVEPFVIGPPTHHLDFHVDVPPYLFDSHLKLLLAGFVTTSVGIVVRRGQ